MTTATTQILRIVPCQTASGPSNMACDEALLESAVANRIATLRFYSWTVPTVTLGYFQTVADFHQHSQLAGLAWIRRATGGATIVHDPEHELTYALALPAGKAWQPTGESWICRMHYIIRDALSQFGVQSRAVVCGEETKLGPSLCFQHHTPGDLTLDGRKIAGSAQRKWKGALLQHGSIALSQSPFTPELPGIGELSAIRPDRVKLMDAIIAQLVAQTGWQVEQIDLTAEDLQVATRLQQTKYDTAEWNARR